MNLEEKIFLTGSFIFLSLKLWTSLSLETSPNKQTNWKQFEFKFHLLKLNGKTI